MFISKNYIEFWRKALGLLCTVKTLDDITLMAIEISIGNKNVFVLNVYMSFDSNDNYDEFLFISLKLRLLLRNIPLLMLYLMVTITLILEWVVV